jgi:hypothetical protein
VKQRFYGPDRDPVSRHVGEDLLGTVLADVLTDAQLAALLDRLHGAPPGQMARRIRIPERALENELAGLLAVLRDSPHRDGLRAELETAYGPLHSARVWHARDHVPVPRCERPGCGKLLEQKPVGRMRQYCDAKCRQAAYRQRKKSLPTAPAPAREPAPARAPAALSRLWYHRSVVRHPYRLTDAGRPPELTTALTGALAPTGVPARSDVASRYSYRIHIGQALELWHSGGRYGEPRAYPSSWPTYPPVNRTPALP